MPHRVHPARRVAPAILSVFYLNTLAHSAPPTRTDGGELTQVDGITVLRIHGDPQQRGRAHGYLLAPQIVALVDGYLSAANISGGVERYEATIQLMQNLIDIAPPYRDELRGMLAGIEERLKGDTTIATLGRKLTLGDLIAINCVPDVAGFGCSSFSAWKSLTHEGHTITGRNLDWHNIDALRESQIVIAHVPAKDEKGAAWVSVAWPGLIVCLTGMNEYGVTMAMHDVHVGSPPSPAGITPRGFALREAIEAARAESAKADVQRVLKRCKALVGNNVHVTNPYDGKSFPSRVFEYDGFTRDGDGVTVRTPRSCLPEGERRPIRFQVTTNHYRCRGDAEDCSRYQKLAAKLMSLSNGEDGRLTVDKAWDLLDSVAVSGRITTYQSVVFEPNARQLHVSLCTADDAAPNGKRSTIRLDQLLRRQPGVATIGAP